MPGWLRPSRIYGCSRSRTLRDDFALVRPPGPDPAETERPVRGARGTTFAVSRALGRSAKQPAESTRSRDARRPWCGGEPGPARHHPTSNGRRAHGSCDVQRVPRSMATSPNSEQAWTSTRQV